MLALQLAGLIYFIKTVVLLVFTKQCLIYSWVFFLIVLLLIWAALSRFPQLFWIVQARQYLSDRLGFFLLSSKSVMFLYFGPTQCFTALIYIPWEHTNCYPSEKLSCQQHFWYKRKWLCHSRCNWNRDTRSGIGGPVATTEVRFGIATKSFKKQVWTLVAHSGTNTLCLRSAETLGLKFEIWV